MFISGSAGKVLGMLSATFNSSRCFGLSEEAAWDAVDDALVTVGREATVSEFLDKLAGTLARRILVNEREASRSAGRGKARRRG
jgi:hypothetical protein